VLGSKVQIRTQVFILRTWNCFHPNIPVDFAATLDLNPSLTFQPLYAVGAEFVTQNACYVDTRR